MIACVLLTHSADGIARPETTMLEVAQQFSPRVAWMDERSLALDLNGLQRLFGDARTIADELRRMLADAGLTAHVAVAGTRTAAHLLAQARAGTTIVKPGEEAAALAPLPVALLQTFLDPTVVTTTAVARTSARFYRTSPVQELVRSRSSRPAAGRSGPREDPGGSRSGRHLSKMPVPDLVMTFRRWGLRTLGDVAALPADELAARLGPHGPALQALARGEDVAPLVPLVPDEQFEATLPLEWPIEGLEPLSFVLGRLCDPVCAQLDRRGRAAAVLHVELKLITREIWARRLELPAPIKDARTLRTLALLDLESNPPPAGIDAVTVRVDPTPARTVQHSLLERARPAPEQVSTLTARLGALMGERRVGMPVLVDSHRSGAFRLERFTGDVAAAAETAGLASPRPPAEARATALRRFRHPVPARVSVEEGRPTHMRTTRAGMPGGGVTIAAGPWRSSGEWWAVEDTWDSDEWDVALASGVVCRLVRDRRKDRWYIEGVYD